MAIIRINTVGKAILKGILKFSVENFKETYQEEFMLSVWRLLKAVARYSKSVLELYWIAIHWQFKQTILYSFLTRFHKELPLEPNSILDLPLSIRSCNSLLNGGIRTIPQLIQLREQDLPRHCGRRSRKEIQAVLAERGLHLGMDASNVVLLFPRRP